MKKTILILSAVGLSLLGKELNAQQIPTQDLVVEYKFDTGNFIETSGSSYNAGGITPSHTASFVPGIEQGTSAISPDGASLSNVGNITFSGNVKEYVVSFWFKANQGTGDFQLLELKDPGSSNGLTIDVLNFSNNTSALTVNQVSQGTSPTGTYNSFASYLDNEWHHLAVKLVYWTTGGKYYLRAYLDDIEIIDNQNVVSLSNVWVFGGLDIYLPSQTTGNGTSQDLKIDNFRFYEFPIDQADITALYNEKNTSSCANIVNIPDANFKTALLEHGTTITGAGISPIDTDGDGEICETEAQAYTGNIQIPSQGISDLTGIEAFTALTVLNCSSNQLTNLDVSANTALLTLNCTFNQLTSLNVANGNNNNMTMMTAFNNPNLTCIQHDTGYTPTPWVQGEGWLKDATASWSENCGTAGIEDFDSALNISIYPNPTNGDFTINLGETIQSLTIYITDITGKEVYSNGYKSTQKVNLNLNDAPGVYFVTIEADGVQSKYKLIKK
ncbi:hypothetical protein CW751_04605 [Brumimicrobium salinarum]|uniref:Secretion system C-terminal sorting domain-containing protein n=1 Tax=Brumimicrobium salinarum TaxID=2058658 RepID=A0A2I0R435_9FLAO|nr:T9SS type A sorting domain-containing protein [Brumimicrobium salinarum]PKR81341.1 hypothetical protein CW751_04605 [Brumimicrobium salinarum]